MEKKTLTVLVIVLGIIVIFETLYLVGIKKKHYPRSRSVVYTTYMPQISPEYAQRSLAAQSWDPEAEMRLMRRQIDSMFEDSFDRAGQRQVRDFRSKKPQFSMEELPAGYRVNMDLPGMNEEDINIEYSGRFLTVSAEHGSQEERQGDDAYQQQGYGYFLRTLTLPDDADASGIESGYSNGVLTINVPKLPAKNTALKLGTKVPVKKGLEAGKK